MKKCEEYMKESREETRKEYTWNTLCAKKMSSCKTTVIIVVTIQNFRFQKKMSFHVRPTPQLLKPKGSNHIWDFKTIKLKLCLKKVGAVSSSCSPHIQPCQAILGATRPLFRAM
jgi:hypothetical protein